MIIAFTGAGISRDSGISTFMEQPKIRERLYRSYAKKNPKRYNQTIAHMSKIMRMAQPNDAHIALNEYGIDIITMNVDGLHEKAGSKPLLLHGSMPKEEELSKAHELLNKPVLYGDDAPNYQLAIEKVNQLTDGDVFLIVGASDHTAIAVELKRLAKRNKAEIIEIQSNASVEVRKTLEKLVIEGKL